MPAWFIWQWTQQQPGHYPLFEIDMSLAALENLKKIGKQLDRDIYPAVYNGGFVKPCETDNSETKGKVKRHERQRTRRSKTRPQQSATRGQGPPSETSPLICTELQTYYEQALNAVYEAYPKTRVWYQPEGMLLLTQSALLVDLNRTALFLIVIPYTGNLVVKSWGFWGISNIGVEWIGPRHTNFPDGSICAFEPCDGTWNPGNPLVQLLDLYSVWALRHLHLKTFGRWPGHQAIHSPYERMLELRADEHCGCQHSDRLYGECCQNKDSKRNIVADAIHFSLGCHSGFRKPPDQIIKFVLAPTKPLRIAELLQHSY